ncbi:MAG: Bacterial domain, partial [Bacteroidota bacterium]
IFEQTSKMSSIVVAITSERILVVTPSLFSPSSVTQLPYEKISKVVFYRRSFYNTLEIEYPGGKIVAAGKEWIKRAAKTLYAKAKELSLEHIEFIQMDTRPTAFKGGSFQHFFKNLFRISSN